MTHHLKAALALLTLTASALAAEPTAPVAPAPAPADAAAVDNSSAPPSATAQCLPACRTGFECYGGQCLSICNPPCGPGQFCTAERQCVMAAPAPVYYVAPPATDPYLAAALETKRLERERKAQLRQQWRPFVGAALDVGLTVTDTHRLVNFGPRLQGGVRRHVARFFGVEMKLGLASYSTDLDYCVESSLDSEGNEQCDDWNDVAETRETDVSMAGGFLIGPFGQFYMNPELVFGYVKRSESDWKKGTYPGGNFRLGFMIGREENLDISFAFGGSRLPDQDEGHFRFEIIALRYVF